MVLIINKYMTEYIETYSLILGWWLRNPYQKIDTKANIANIVKTFWQLFDRYFGDLNERNANHTCTLSIV